MENIFDSNLYRKLENIREGKDIARKAINDMKNLANKDNSCIEDLFNAMQKADKDFEKVEYVCEKFEHEIIKVIERTVDISNSLGWYTYYLDGNCINRIYNIWEELFYKCLGKDKNIVIENFDKNIIKYNKNKNKVRETDIYFSNLIRNNLDEIKEIINSNLSERAFFINKLFNNFEEKKYLESLLIGITQADGICNDIFNCQLYSKNRRTDENGKEYYVLGLEEKIKEDFWEKYKKGSYDFTYIQIDALSNINLINESKSKRFCLKNPSLNRHCILHGIELNKNVYNEINCLKVISLLASLAKVNEYKKLYMDVNKVEKDM